MDLTNVVVTSDMDEEKLLTLDGVVAHNVVRLSEANGVTVSDLAGRLGVSRGRVYDMRRARPGRPQRQFLWTDLVALCAAFDVTLFDLVLPPLGFQIVGDGAAFLATEREEVIATRRVDRGVEYVVLGHVGRKGAALRLFGYPDLNATKLSSLADRVSKEIADSARAMDEELRSKVRKWIEEEE